MPEIINWNEFDNSKKSKSGEEIRRLRLESGKTYKVRFVGPPIQYLKYFVAGRSAICADKESCPVRAKYNIEPSTRYAINVIDREDGQLKILECPPTVLNPVATWMRGTNQDPGGKNGPDFFIQVKGKAKMTRYEVSALQVTPLTEDEKEYVRDNIYDLEKIYKATDPDEIENRLFPKDGDGNSDSGHSAGHSAPRSTVKSNTKDLAF
jgi:hypothetical protein